MKSISLNCLTYARNLFYYFDEIKRWLFLGLVVPLVICVIVMEWDYKVFLFIMMGYGAALVGFLFAKTPVGKILLAEEEDLFNRLVVRSKQEVAFVHDLETGRNVFITSSVKAVLGYQPHHIISRYCTFLFHPEDRKKMTQLLSEKSIEAKTKLTAKLRVMDKGNGFRWMTFTVNKPDETYGQDRYVVCTLKDIQHQQKIEKASELYFAELMKKAPTLFMNNEVSNQETEM